MASLDRELYGIPASDRRRKLMIFLVSAVMLISTFFVISRIPDIYESRASVVVAGPQEDRQAVVTRVAAITERLNSRSFLETVIERHNLYPSAVQSGRMESAVGRLRRDIKVDTKWRNDRPEVLSMPTAIPSRCRKGRSNRPCLLFGKMNEAIDKPRMKKPPRSARDSQVENQLGQLGAPRRRRRSSKRAGRCRRDY